ncbi:MAG: hypothetical protein H6662_19130 [Ardenticatenaceae bacterium]|nr:hypothetical protein [Anaerolineales bacterium]MCB8923706.1 hypothetical protein [Ardenticatenaceae bacterium]
MLQISLLGRFHASYDGQPVKGIDGLKVQELFSYLLLHRNRPHSRNMLACLLWEDGSPAQGKSYLRKTLWQLQSALDSLPIGTTSSLLLADSNWIELNPQVEFWLDVAMFEEACHHVSAISTSKLTRSLANELRQAVDLYSGDLLDGWYQDWCLFERERLQHIHYMMLQKLMDFCEEHSEYEAGIEYGMRILRSDLARERTHRSLMRLHYLAGNRTEALRQYERCAAVLRQELDVEPDQHTLTLYKRIQAALPLATEEELALPAFILDTRVDKLKQLQSFLDTLSIKVKQEIQTIETNNPRA